MLVVATALGAVYEGREALAYVAILLIAPCVVLALATYLTLRDAAWKARYGRVKQAHRLLDHIVSDATLIPADATRDALEQELVEYVKIADEARGLLREIALDVGDEELADRWRG
jgi:hypothetical protein